MKLIVASLTMALTLLLSTGDRAVARNVYDRLVAFCGGVFELCGYFDRRAVKVAIPNMFERAVPFSEGLAAVRIEGRYGFIDRQGRVVIAPRFDLAGQSRRGLAEVLMDGRTGVIDRSGAIVVAPQFKRSIPFTDKVIIAAEGRWRRRGVPGFERLGDLWTTSVWMDRWGLFHIHDGWIVRPRFVLEPLDRSGRDLIVASENDDRGPFGVLRPDGSWEVEPTYSNRGELYRDHAQARQLPRHPRDTKRVREALDALRGRRTRRDDPPDVKRRSILTCRGGARLVFRDGAWGIVGPDGKFIVAPRHRAIDCFKRGVAWVPVDQKAKWCPVGPDGKLRDRPACSKMHFPYYPMHSFNMLDGIDPYESSVRWMLAFLDYGRGARDRAPRFISVGWGSHTSFPADYRP